jgi:hypothetical protein
MGFVATRTTLLATDVNFRELIQKEKWRDRKKPPSIPMRRCFLLYEERPIPLLFAMINKMMDERVSRYVAIMMEGTSLQNRIKMEAKEMATIPMDTPAKILTKGCLSLHFEICSSFCKYHG